ncbi:hypothetical protein [Sphingobacterium multivorum]|uniref:hypothetical protein n=1 Tax=Sphingobacterium multivorum TaxID=28454 RepID=UPI0031BB6897
MKDEKEILMYDSDEIVTYRTDIKGWVGKDGRYYGDGEAAEHMARWSNCTHTKCSCGNIIISRSYSDCQSCRETKWALKYDSYPIVKWDGETPLAIFNDDVYFFSLDDILSYCEDNALNVEDLKLVLCQESNFREIDLEYFADETHEDWEPSKNLKERIKEFNEFIRSESTNTWFPLNVRVIIK